jgi:hypothetical protein
MRFEIRFWSKEESITIPVGTRRHEVISKKDYEIAKANGISPQTAYHRRKVLKWPVEKCVTEPVTDQLEWEVWKEAAAIAGISYAGFWKRRKKGMTPEQAATTPNKKRTNLCNVVNQ